MKLLRTGINLIGQERPQFYKQSMRVKNKTTNKIVVSFKYLLTIIHQYYKKKHLKKINKYINNNKRLKRVMVIIHYKKINAYTIQFNIMSHFA